MRGGEGEIGKKKGKKKKTALSSKQSISKKEFSYFREHAESSVIAAFAGHRLSKQ